MELVKDTQRMTQSDIQPERLIALVVKSFSSNNENDNVKWDYLQQYFSNINCDSDICPSFSTSYYSILSCLIDSLKPTLFTESWKEQLFDNLFLKGINHDSFILLVRKLGETNPSYAQDKILSLLENFLHMDNLESMLLCQCISNKNWDLNYISKTVIWNDLVTLLVSLPERVANKTKGNSRKIFASTFYIPLLASSLLKVLKKLHQKIIENQDCTLEFLGQLFGRLCITGHANIVVKKFSTEIIKLSETDFIWRRISHNLIKKIPSNSLESFITQLLLILPWYGYVDWIIADEGIKNPKLQYIMTTKLISIRHFQQELILHNIFGYLASSSYRESQFFKTFDSLLSLWADESALKYHSFPQQYYLASALIVCAGWLKKLEFYKKEMKTDYLDKTLHGVQIRIGNSEASTRNLGMIVGENLVTALNPEAPSLKFELPEDAELKSLCNLSKIPAKPEIEFCLSVDELKLFNEVNENEEKISLKINEEIVADTKKDLDSDDDLEPYDQSNDIPLQETKRPLYIRDCMQGLIEQENPEWTEMCLKYAENLIHSNSEMIHEIAVEMTKVLLHLEDKFSITDFVCLRHQAMVALITECPILVAKHLTAQFYERDYNIRQRLDILEVLVAGSQELSRVKKIMNHETQHCPKKMVASTDKTWKLLIDQRIESKTRRFAKTPKKPEPNLQKNKFAPVAGYFFFPLMEKYDKGSKILNLLGDDSYVLGRLLYTLGIVMYSATNIPLARQMGSTFLQFLTAVRNNTDVFVRQAAIFGLTTIYMSVPSFILFTDLYDDVKESHSWLQEIINKDPDIHCQVKATNAYNLLLNLMKEEMPLIMDFIGKK